MVSNINESSSQEFINISDVILTIRDNILILILVPILIGIISVTITTSFSRTYKSEVVLINISNINIETLKLPKIIDKISLMHEPTKNIEKVKARSIIKSSFKSSLDKNGILTITAFGENSKDALALAQIIGKELEELQSPVLNMQKYINRKEAKLESLENYLITINSIIKNSSPANEGYLDVLNTSNNVETEIKNLKEELLDLKADTNSKHIIQPAIIDDVPLSRGTAKYAIYSSLITGFIILIFLFLRKIIKQTLINEKL